MEVVWTVSTSVRNRELSGDETQSLNLSWNFFELGVDSDAVSELTFRLSGVDRLRLDVILPTPETSDSGDIPSSTITGWIIVLRQDRLLEIIVFEALDLETISVDFSWILVPKTT